MPILTLNFAGYGQCRLATDPDPTNERRGVSGYTFALPGEPDLDWIIRTQPPAVERVCVDRPIGVRVTGGFAGSAPIVAGHPLFDAPVELMDEPRFEERNYVVTKTTFGVIFPFRFRVSGAGIAIRRDVDFYPGTPLDRLVTEIPQSVLAPYTMQGMDMNVAACQELLGDSKNPSVYRLERLRCLQRYKRDHELTPPATAAIDKRISELEMDDPRDRRTSQLVNRANFNYLLNGPAVVETGETGAAQPNWLNGKWQNDNWSYAEPNRPLDPWPCQFWMGSWDADSLSFYMQGTVKMFDLDAATESVLGLM